MADNVTLQNDEFATPPVGTAVAADVIGGVAHQRVKVQHGADGSATDVSAASPLPVELVSGGTVPLPTGAASEATLATRLTEADFDTKVGALTETAPADDTASSGLNGRLQRVAQRLTTLLAVFPTTIDTNSGVKSASTLRVVLATDQPALTNKLLVTPDANSAVNLAQVAGASVATGNGTAAGAVRVALPTDGTGVVGLNAGTNTIGKTYAALQTTKALTNANVSASSSGENTLVSGTASQTIRIFAGSFTAASAVTLTFKDAAGGNTLATIPLAANGSFSFDTMASGEPLWVTATAGAFILSLSSAVAVTGFVQYVKS